ncbi:MAG TPA: hypothetical protein VGQ35_19880 [Dongiaceae bacterium]|jgi:hypothetical protein|nr:hypothetical protein [Dongiaceae bacterium]
MFLIDRPAGSPGLRADLAPRQLFGGTGDLVRAALMARPPAAKPPARRPASQLDLALPAPARRRKAG